MVADGLIFMDKLAIMEFGTPEYFFQKPGPERIILFFEPDTLGLQIIL